MEALTPWHLILILIGFMLLFGYKKLPDATRSLGRSVRIFKSEMREMGEPSPASGGATQPDRPSTPTLPAAVSLTDLEAEAAAAEAEAAELRARANAHAEMPQSTV